MMKKILILFAAMLIADSSFSQVPQAFNYQAVIRDNTGTLLIDEDVSLQVDILKGAVDGPASYSETHSVRTNAYGLVTLAIGSGTTTNDFSSIEWHTDSHFIKLWINGNEMGTTQLLSVPYAMHAHSAGVFTGDEIKNLVDPVDDQDAVTKAYVDRQITYPGIRIQAEVDSVQCFGSTNGAIDLTITGGTPPYIYEWDNGSTTEDLPAIDAGKYQVYVEDSNGVTAFRHFTLQDPEEIVITYMSNPGTGEIDLSVTGGKPPYTYQWSNGSTEEDLSGLEMGSYTVEVTDDAGCTGSEIIQLGGESMLLAEYLESADSPANNYINTEMPSLRTAATVKTLMALDKVYIVDIRSADNYSLGHIEGAVNVAANDVLDHLETADLSAYDEISVVGYTGQVASWVTCLLRLAGYENVYAMKYGMCSWHSDFASPWQDNIGNAYAAQFVNSATSKGPAGDLPEIVTGGSTQQEIFEARLDVVFTEGFGAAAIPAADVFANLGNYYIVNYWPEAEYTDPGHIAGAIQYTPKYSIALETDLKTLPTDKTIVVYEYSGQTSASLVAYLRLLGFDAKSLKFGTNGMIYDEMTKAKWSDAAIMDYEYVSE